MLSERFSAIRFVPGSNSTLPRVRWLFTATSTLLKPYCVKTSLIRLPRHDHDKLPLLVDTRALLSSSNCWKELTNRNVMHASCNCAENEAF